MVTRFKLVGPSLPSVRVESEPAKARYREDRGAWARRLAWEAGQRASSMILELLQDLDLSQPVALLDLESKLYPLLARFGGDPVVAAVIECVDRDGAILLYRRPSSGLWGGLWSLPELDDLDALGELARQHALHLDEPRELAGLTHTFSHFQLAIEPWLVRVEQAGGAVAEGDWLWYNLATPPRLGLAAPVKKLLKRAADELNAGELP